MIEKAILFFLFVWGVATIFYQFKATSDFVGKWNYFALIPRWTFFAPRPKTTDYLFCYQDCDGVLANASDPVIVELTQRAGLRSALRFIWNPNKRNTKAIVDITGFIISYASTHKARIAKNALLLETYVPYILLLNFVSGHAPPSRPDCRRRFLVLSTNGSLQDKHPVKVLESNFHRIEP